MFLTFGSILFQGVKLPQKWEGTHETEYSNIDIIGKKPVVQGIGEKLDEYDIDIFLHSDFCDPRTEFEALQDIRKRGVINELVDGTGHSFGRFVITSLGVSNIINSDDGYPIAISVALHLLEYNGAGVSSPDAEAIRDEVSWNLYEPGASRVPVKMSAPMRINADIKNATQKASSIRDKINVAVSFTQGMYNKIAKTADEVKQEFDKVNAQVEKTKKLIYRAKDLKNSITMVNSALQDIKSAAEIRNFDDLLAANNFLSQSMYYLDKSKAPVVAFLASRESGN
ncbi:MAG: phage tail protein [Prevotella sp.]|jgi:phage protein U|nr:phage tail protein [Prevotella sp.]